MKLAMRLTLDGLVRALRMKAHSLAEGRRTTDTFAPDDAAGNEGTAWRPGKRPAGVREETMTAPAAELQKAIFSTRFRLMRHLLTLLGSAASSTMRRPMSPFPTSPSAAPASTTGAPAPRAEPSSSSRCTSGRRQRARRKRWRSWSSRARQARRCVAAARRAPSGQHPARIRRGAS